MKLLSTSENSRVIFCYFFYTSMLLSTALLSFCGIFGHKGLLEITSGYLSSIVVLASSLLFFNWARLKPLKTMLILLVLGFIVRICTIAVILAVVVCTKTQDISIFVMSFLGFYVIHEIFKVWYFSKTMGDETK